MNVEYTSDAERNFCFPMLTSVVIPVYNSSSTIGPLVDRLLAGLGRTRLQIVLVNDGSSDNSHEICRAIATQHAPLIRYVRLSRNFGEHNAVMAGLNYATGDYVVIIDDDFQNPPEEVSRLVDTAVRGNFDIVFTHSKQQRQHWFRRLGSRFNNWVAGFLIDKPKDLYLSSFKCINRFLVEQIIQYKGPFPYIDGLALRCTKSIGRLEVGHDKRREGESGYTLRKLVHLWLNMFVNFSVMPLRISTGLGLVFGLIGIILCAVVILEKLRHPEVAVGWPSLIVTVIVFSSAQLLMLGLIGEYIGRLFMGQNRTPQFVVRDIAAPAEAAGTVAPKKG